MISPQGFIRLVLAGALACSIASAAFLPPVKDNQPPSLVKILERQFDLDGDGRLDSAFYAEGTPANRGVYIDIAGKQKRIMQLQPYERVRDIYFRDVNKDLRLDILVEVRSEGRTYLYSLLGAGLGRFTFEYNTGPVYDD